ncbi:MAG TPA: purine/pyrimidine permease [Methanocorpusculum sp.]|nr:purine/pyrimidine permease [Methanocorpusculum sp.]HJK13377.1 purine/pyrimidine permease [Methanocorpusculum sp.]HJK20993.1 purine/pyrimidine permease [Methanocorpusculum sp.]HJK25786.1 purine/pyrimidine permease [Methanocorpusculum sp.]HJK26602.1 purine/pyrimidine permease [Methanocorpusculum sp.]
MDSADRPVYNVGDNVPPSVLVLSILQHFFVLAVYMTYPVIITKAINGGEDLSTFLISATLIGSGIATILQAIRYTGCGYIFPMVPNSSYLPASMLAATAGGLPLLYGMMIVSGFLEMILSRLTRYFRVLFPGEVVGVVMFMLGLAIIPFSFPLFFGSGDTGPLDPAATAVGIITLGSMIILGIQHQKIFRFYAVLIGIIIGFASSVLFGVLTLADIESAGSTSLFSIPNPVGIVSYSFDVGLLIPFAIGMLCVMLKSAGNIALLDEYTGETGRGNLRRGILSEGFGAAVCSAIGGIGIGSSASNTGLIPGTGIASRKIGLGLGLFLIICGFLPAIGWFFHIMPEPIMGAVVIYAIAFIMLGGVQSISSRVLDNRRTFVVILPIMIGVSSVMCPNLYTALPETIQLFFASPLTSGAIFVVVLGLLFKIGLPTHNTIRFGDHPEADVSRLLLDCGRLWTMDKTQMFQIIHHIQALIRAMPEGMHPEQLTLTLKNSTGALTAELIVPGPVDEAAMKSAGHYPATVMVTAAADKTIIRSGYRMI